MKAHHTKRDLAKERKRNEVVNPDEILNPPYRPPVYCLTQETLQHCNFQDFISRLTRLCRYSTRRDRAKITNATSKRSSGASVFPQSSSPPPLENLVEDSFSETLKGVGVESHDAKQNSFGRSQTQ